MKHGKRFAGDLATRLDLHPPSGAERSRREEERILGLIAKATASARSNPQAVVLLSQAIEMHARKFGQSPLLQEAMMSLLEASCESDAEPPPLEPEPPAPRLEGHNVNRPLRVPFKARSGFVKA